MAQANSSDLVGAARPAAPRAFFLVGFMGAGKTSVGREVSLLLGWSFIDLDDRIEASQGRSVTEIFAELGEPAFRQAETRALVGLLGELKVGLNAVIALGGGAYVQADNAQAIRATGLPVVFLDAPVQELRQRCAPQGAGRPLFQDEDRFRELYQSRRSGYMQADFRVDTLAKTVHDVAQEVITLLSFNAQRQSP